MIGCTCGFSKCSASKGAHTCEMCQCAIRNVFVSVFCMKNEFTIMLDQNWCWLSVFAARISACTTCCTVFLWLELELHDAGAFQMVWIVMGLCHGSLISCICRFLFLDIICTWTWKISAEKNRKWQTQSKPILFVELCCQGLYCCNSTWLGQLCGFSQAGSHHITPHQFAGICTRIWVVMPD